MVAVERLKITRDKGLQLVILEGDSRLRFELIESNAVGLPDNRSLVHDISVLGLSFVRFKAQYVPRCCNKIVNSLAHLAKLVGSRIWIGEIANCIRDLVTLDLQFE